MCLVLKVTHFQTNIPTIFLQLLHDTLLRYELINESSSRVNISTDNYMETIIAINDDGLFPKCDTLSMGRKQPKNTREKGTKIKDATIRNKFTETINVIICTAISTQKVPHPSNYLESKKRRQHWEIS